MDHQGLNNFNIKNWYRLPLIDKILDRLNPAKYFIQLDLISTYYWMRIWEGDK